MRALELDTVCAVLESAVEMRSRYSALTPFSIVQSAVAYPFPVPPVRLRRTMGASGISVQLALVFLLASATAREASAGLCPRLPLTGCTQSSNVSRRVPCTGLCVTGPAARMLTGT